MRVEGGWPVKLVDEFEERTHGGVGTDKEFVGIMKVEGQGLRHPSGDGDLVLTEAEQNQLARADEQPLELPAALDLSQVETGEKRTLPPILVELNIRPVAQVACRLLQGLVIGCSDDALIKH